ncbi:MAG: flagellar hook-length control protein FliK, partial [Planctomycetota bacterium]|nr:flagellar hook-length control protein FliK [Planctomycetota bacterium]
LSQAAVNLSAAEGEEQLANFLATSGRLALAKAQGLLEEACRLLLASQPVLRNYDSALEAIRQALGLPSSFANAEPAASQPNAVPLVQILRQAVQAALPGVWEIETRLGSLAADAALTAGDERAATAARLIAEARDPETAAEIARRFSAEHPSLTRDLAARLQGAEEESLRQHPALRALTEAAAALSEAGRRLLAYRAESLAGLRHEPAYFAAEIPIRFQGDRENGLLRVYWRCSPRAISPWNARVVLDLQTTRLGPVAGDMLFRGREINLRLYAASPETADYLASGQEELTAALRQKGFNCLPRFAVIPQPQTAAEQEEKTATPPSPTAHQGAIDLEA